MKRIREYSEALTYLYEQLPMYQREGSSAFKKSLDNIIALSEVIGNPHHSFPSIHIAGTNGKGSTSHIISAILIEQGYRVGIYTSPHYLDFRERIKINDTYIGEKEVISFLNQFQEEISGIQPSFFELCVAMAFDYFARKEVDIAVIETGLGGRLDSTNIITPLVSLITNIAFDHQEMLGNTLPLIAIEKAGIIKHGRSIIIGEKNEETTPSFERIARERQAPLYYAEDILEVIKIESDLVRSKIEIAGIGKNFTCTTSLIGDFQVGNIRNALATLFILKELNVTLGERKIELGKDVVSKGLKNIYKNTGMMGKFQVVSEMPLFIVDSAHNMHGVQACLKELSEIDYEQLFIITGCVKDKNWQDIITMLPTYAHYYFCSPAIPRALDVETLNAFAKTSKLKGKKYTSVAEATQAAINDASPFDMVLTIGSTFVAAEVLAYFQFLK